MSKVIGIDLGTTNSVVAVMEGGEPTVITNPEGSRLTPSVVGFTKDGERLVGQLAKRQAVSNPDRTIASIKRHMGTDYKVTIDGSSYTPPQISAMILQKLKADAEKYLSEEVTQAVITVPAYFNDSQRQATKDAGKIAGLDVLRIVNEPTAAAIAYGLDKTDSGKAETILVFDLGGGTFDVSILNLDDGMFQVVATNGNTHLGGDDFDHAVMNWMVEEFKKTNGIDLSQDKMAAQRLLEAAEKAKIELSNMASTNINLPFITADATGPKHLDLTLSRTKFDILTSDLVEATVAPTAQALQDAGLTPSDIDKVILVGGSSRIPAVQASIAKQLGKEPNHSVNPDECVAVGAAIQAGILAGEFKDKNIVLLDVTPLSLGIETLGGVCTRMIERNTAIPTSKEQVFSTAADNQPAVTIRVFQGEREMAADNKLLGTFELTDIPPAPRGVPQIQVKFDIDSNGIVHVSAKDLGTGKEQNITIKSDSGMSKEDIDRMVQEAKAHEAEDKKRKEAVEVKNNADSLVFQAEKVIKDLGDKADAATVAKVKDGIEGVKTALKGNDTEAIKKATEELQKPLYELSAAAYQQAQQAQQGAAGAGAGTQANPNAGANAQQSQPKDDNTVDAEFKDVTDK